VFVTKKNNGRRWNSETKPQTPLMSFLRLFFSHDLQGSKHHQLGGPIPTAGPILFTAPPPPPPPSPFPPRGAAPIKQLAAVSKSGIPQLEVLITGAHGPAGPLHCSVGFWNRCVRAVCSGNCTQGTPANHKTAVN